MAVEGGIGSAEVWVVSVSVRKSIKMKRSRGREGVGGDIAGWVAVGWRGKKRRGEEVFGGFRRCGVPRVWDGGCGEVMVDG